MFQRNILPLSYSLKMEVAGFSVFGTYLPYYAASHSRRPIIWTLMIVRTLKLIQLDNCCPIYKLQSKHPSTILLWIDICQTTSAVQQQHVTGSVEQFTVYFLAACRNCVVVTVLQIMFLIYVYIHTSISEEKIPLALLKSQKRYTTSWLEMTCSKVLGKYGYINLPQLVDWEHTHKMFFPS